MPTIVDQNTFVCFHFVECSPIFNYSGLEQARHTCLLFTNVKGSVLQTVTVPLAAEGAHLADFAFPPLW